LQLLTAAVAAAAARDVTDSCTDADRRETDEMDFTIEM